MATDEASRIAHLTELFGSADDRIAVPPGDDAAVVRTTGKYAVTSVDSVVEGVDFLREQFPPRAIGHKATAVALSDLAAMGVSAGEVYVAAGLPRDLSDEDFVELTHGIADASTASGALVAGGDLSASGLLWLSVTVVGYADDDDFVRRNEAKPGDVLAVTGDLGRSAMTVELLGDGAAVPASLLARQFAPVPQLAAGQALKRAGATAMIDISDGLSRDSGHVARMSGVKLTIDLAAIPVEPAVLEYASARGIDPLAYAAASGEEYELLVTLPPERVGEATAACAAIGVRLSQIGSVSDTDGEGVAVSVDQTGGVVEIAGFDHFD